MYWYRSECIGIVQIVLVQCRLYWYSAGHTGTVHTDTVKDVTGRTIAQTLLGRHLERPTGGKGVLPDKEGICHGEKEA